MSKSLITTIDPDDIVEKLPPIHPGEILREDFLRPLALTSYALAKALHVPRTRIERLVREETAITTDTALRLGRYFSTGPEVWLNLQQRYELECARRNLPVSIDAIKARPSTSIAAE